MEFVPPVNMQITQLAHTWRVSASCVDISAASGFSVESRE